jgi:hypothetical protein
VAARAAGCSMRSSLHGRAALAGRTQSVGVAH